MTTYDIKVNTDSDSDIQPKIYSLGPITEHMVETITGIDTEWVRVELVDGADIVAFEGLLNSDPDVYKYKIVQEIKGTRYEVRVIGSRDDSRDMEILHNCILATDDAAEAKAKAEQDGGTYHYGTAVIDRTAGTVDFGADENGGPWIVPVAQVDVRPDWGM